MSESSQAPEHGHFVTTHWSAVLKAGREETPSAEAALAELCQAYWYPLYAFARRQGQSPADAEDLTQAFFTRLLEKNYVAGARPEKGTFRAFLLTAFKHFMANEWDRHHAQKRGGFQTHLEIDQAAAEARFDASFAHQLQPDVLYERHWAMTLLEAVMHRLQEEYAGTGRSQIFDKLRGSLAKGEGAPYAQIAGELALTEAAVKTAVHRMRTRYRELLREEIGRTVSSPAEVEEELRHLFAAFG